MKANMISKMIKRRKAKRKKDTKRTDHPMAGMDSLSCNRNDRAVLRSKLQLGINGAL